jgi:CheY-like chemotaxis protein
MFRLQAEAKGLMFIYECKDNLPEFVRTDEKRLRQILINLLSNAIKYTSKGNVTFSVRYRNQVAEFVVSDTGEGVASENLERIFRPFERVSRPGSTTTGTGLGLTITRLLTEIMGGDISVSSQLDQGSQFKISLMLSAITQTKNQPVTLVQQPILGYQGAIKRLIVVDDDASHRQLMKAMLLPLGFEVIDIENPQRVLSELAAEKEKGLSIDLFMLDVSMPGMDGWELVKQLREADYFQPIMMVSADASEGRNSLQPLAPETAPLHQSYVIKPVRLQLLLDHLGRLLNLTWTYENLSAQELYKQELSKQELPKQELIAPQMITTDKKGEITGKDLDEISRLAAIGHKKGLVKKIEQLKDMAFYDEAEIVFFEKIVKCANHFQFEAILSVIDDYSAITDKP